MTVIPLYTQDPDIRQPLSPVAKAQMVRTFLEVVLTQDQYLVLAEHFGAVVVVSQEVHDALLTDQLEEECVFIISNAALQAEDCAYHRDAPRFDDNYFGRIEIHYYAGFPPLFRFPLIVGREPQPAAQVSEEAGDTVITSRMGWELEALHGC